MRTIAFYVSGHGFGHAARDIEVINALLAQADVRVVARTTVPAWLFERTVRADAADRFRRDECETDTGVIQIDSLHLDERATVLRARDFMRTFAARVAAEANWLGRERVSLVVADIPPLGIAAARRAGVPAVGLANFTWDWIYFDYPGAADVVAQIADVYASADLALRLPMHGGFETFPRIVDVPFVARRSVRDAADTRTALGLPLDRHLALLSFGGYGLDRIQQEPLRLLDGWSVVGSRALPLDEHRMYDRGFRYEDVVRAADVVVTKPGYGIVSEVIANETAVLYTSRGRFAEYDVFVREMPRVVRARFIDHDMLFAGDWQAALDALIEQPDPPERPPVNGAETAARLLLDMI